MKRGRYNVHFARRWYLASTDILTRSSLSPPRPNRQLEAFCTALLRSLLPKSAVPFPDTFNLDADRLRALRIEVEDLMYENICCQVLTDLVAAKGNAEDVTEEARLRLRGDLRLLIADGKFLTLPIGNVSVEIVRHALRLSGSSAEYDGDLVDLAERRLRETHNNLVQQQEHAEDLMADIFPDLLNCVEKYMSSSPWDMFNALVPPASSTQSPSISSISSAGTTRASRRSDIIHRIAHIAVLHWRIWEHIVYNNEDIDPNEPPRDGRASGPGVTSRSPTPTPPIIATALVLPPQAATGPIASTSAKEIDQSQSDHPKLVIPGP
jgi:hypothetical protein